MASDLPPVVFDDDNPEWTEEDFARARPAAEMLPPEVLAAFARAREERRAQDAEQVTLRLDKPALDRFRATGPDWEDRLNDALRAAAARLDAPVKDAA